MDEPQMSSAIRERLALQNEVLKWITEFTERMEKRANEATMDVNGLLDQAGALEVDLKNAFNSFRCLSLDHCVDHRIADDGDTARHSKRTGSHSAESSIPAQDYETDILPRYREALSLGLSSCKNYFQNANTSHSVRSFFSPASVHGQLPHIIGSDEYNHDISCGITEDTSMGTQPLDFSRIAKAAAASPTGAEHEMPNIFGPEMFSMKQDSSVEDESQTLSTAALDFKAMLEAALLNTYKFYDEESSSMHDVDDSWSTGGTKLDMIDIQNVSEEKIASVAEENPAFSEVIDLHSPELSALVIGSLFDADEDLHPVEELLVDHPAELAVGPSVTPGISKEEFEEKVSLDDASNSEKN